MKRKIYVILLFIFTSVILTSCVKEFGDDYSELSKESIKEFENNFISNLVSKTKTVNTNDILIIGYQTIKIRYVDRERTIESLSNLQLTPPSDSLPSVNFYVAPDGSFVRIYFEVVDAILKHQNNVLMPSSNGRVELNNIENISNVCFIGQKRTNERRGTGGNIVTQDKILFNENIPMTSAYTKENALIYNFGERIVGQCSERMKRSNLLSTKTETSGGGRISCRDNHGGKICSFKYSFVTGRCSHCYTADRCMDFNGDGTDCVNYGDGMWNKTRNFIGSDCYWLISHCLNESF